jgi:hypothetical protein
MKKQRKSQKKHLFARTCRVIGRFLLATGAVLCVASGVLALSPLLTPQHPVSSPKSYQHFIDIPQGPNATATPAATSTSSDSFLIPSLIVVAIVIFILALAFRYYNDSIRKFIARSAKVFRTEILVAELILSTVIWIIANLIIIANCPIFAILTLPALIFNDLFFIFAWTSYGCPTYSL